MNAAVTRKTTNDAAATALKVANIAERKATLTSTKTNALRGILELKTIDDDFCTTQQVSFPLFDNSFLFFFVCNRKG